MPLQQNLHLCFAGMCPWGPRLAAPVPPHHTQPSMDPMGGLELCVGCSAPEHNNTGHSIFPSSCKNPSSSGVRQSRRFPCRDYSGSGQPDAKGLPAFLLVWSRSTGAAKRREMHVCKNQCESINQAKSERLKKSRGSRVMCVIERGFLYLQRPPRLPSCRGNAKLSAPLSKSWLAAWARCEPAVPAWVLMPRALQPALPSPCRGIYL